MSRPACRWTPPSHRRNPWNLTMSKKLPATKRRNPPMTRGQQRSHLAVWAQDRRRSRHRLALEDGTAILLEDGSTLYLE